MSGAMQDGKLAVPQPVRFGKVGVEVSDAHQVGVELKSIIQHKFEFQVEPSASSTAGCSL